jgi:hypothetical protein
MPVLGMCSVATRYFYCYTVPSRTVPSGSFEFPKQRSDVHNFMEDLQTWAPSTNSRSPFTLSLVHSLFGFFFSLVRKKGNTICIKLVIRGLRHTRLELRPRSTWRNTHAIRKGETTRNPVRNRPRSSCEKTRGGSGQTGI